MLSRLSVLSIIRRASLQNEACGLQSIKTLLRAPSAARPCKLSDTAFAQHVFVGQRFSSPVLPTNQATDKQEANRSCCEGLHLWRTTQQRYWPQTWTDTWAPSDSTKRVFTSTNKHRCSVSFKMQVEWNDEGCGQNFTNLLVGQRTLLKCEEYQEPENICLVNFCATYH